LDQFPQNNVPTNNISESIVLGVLRLSQRYVVQVYPCHPENVLNRIVLSNDDIELATAACYVLSSVQVTDSAKFV
jgi:hypothetical protein